MDRDERQKDQVLSVDRDANINVVVNQPSADVEIDLKRVFQNFRLRTRVYAWLLLFCLVAGMSGGLLAYQFNQKPLRVTSVVTLKYSVPDPVALETDPNSTATCPVTDLTAPDGSGELDLNQITGSFVLNNAMNGLELSQPVTLSSLRSNIRIDRILTEDSRRQQEIAASMVEDKNNNAYTQVMDIQLTYDNRFVVSLTNGFGEEGSRRKLFLTDGELRDLLDRILAAYNDYLVRTYADTRLPDDEISVIDTQRLDLLESLDLLRTATQDLYNYCDSQPEEVRSYRSWRTGRSLNDLMNDLRTVGNVNVSYLYSYVYANSIARDSAAMVTNYEYKLRYAQSDMDVINENIATVQTILDNYKNDEVFVSMQDSDSAKSTKATTDYYNAKILEQADNYDKAEALQIRINDLVDKLDSLNDKSALIDTEEVERELASAIGICKETYQQIALQMQEIMESTFYTTYADHSVAQGESVSFLAGAARKMIIGGVLGALIALAFWFFSALAPEFRKEPLDVAQAPGARRKKEAIEA